MPGQKMDLMPGFGRLYNNKRSRTNLDLMPVKLGISHCHLDLTSPQAAAQYSTISYYGFLGDPSIYPFVMVVSRVSLGTNNRLGGVGLNQLGQPLHVIQLLIPA